jgi:uncharacterized protein (AIM24 family)
MTDVYEHIVCKWCRGQSAAGSTTCDRCGAPLDVRDAVTESGWRESPRLRDLTEVHCGASVVQVDAGVVPVADVELAAGDAFYFEHHVLLWKDETVGMTVMDMPGGMKRIFAGLPFVLSVAHGPGRVAFSRDAPGELVMVPIDPGVEVDVRGHAMLFASGSLSFSFEKIGGGATMMLSAGTGMYLDRYTAHDIPGLLGLHGYGNVFERVLAEGQTIQVEPGGFLYKDSAVGMSLSTIKLQAGGAAKNVATRGLAGIKAARSIMKGGVAGVLDSGNLQQAAGAVTGPGLTLMTLTGPGRVGIQSMYFHQDTE